jgi:Tol biopolymer transport system component
LIAVPCLRRSACAIAFSLGVAALAIGGTDAATTSKPGPLLTYEVARLSKGPNPKWYSGICLARPDGSHPVQLVPLRATGRKVYTYGRASWSPSGKYVAFFRGAYLVVADARGHVVRKLYSWAKRSGYGDESPAWSPDGRWIAVVGGRASQILLAPASGRGKLRVPVRGPGGSVFESPSWTPDSRRIVFAAPHWAEGDSRVPGIYSVGRNGKGLRLLVAGAQFRQPVVSPNGSKLAYVAAAGDHSHITVANADGSDPHPLGEPSDRRVSTPAWSPDSSLVAFGRTVPASPPNGEGIAVARADGGGERIVIPDRPDYHPSSPSWRRASPLRSAKRGSCS